MLLSPADHVYLDMKYDPTTDLGLEWAGHVELRDAYAWEPDAVVPGLPPEFAVDRAWTAALILIMMVMALNVVARLISRFFAPKTGH